MRRPALVVLLLAALCSALQASERSADPQLLRPGSSLTNEQRLDWAVGRSFTHKPWVSAPATTTARDGLGPWLNANSCLACHPGNGQGQLPENGPGLVLRLPIDSPLGSQLQDRALPGFSAEGRIHWQETLNGALRARRYTVIDQPTLAVSARLAPELRGVAALDQVRDADIVAWADPDDLNGDGISGRPALLPANEESGKARQLGRFGWKAAQPSLAEQIAQAFAEDMGIDSSLRHSRRCDDPSLPPLQQQRCQRASGAAPGEDVEISEKLFNAVLLYFRGLSIPTATATLHPAGKRLFHALDCAACHRPSLPLGDDAIQPYSDLLLHDMGEGLADTVAEGGAEGHEWRTAPLWGLGFRSRDPDNTRLLHDGRAGTIHEAILWHGGEATASVQRYRQLSAQDLNDLIRFLQEL